jgi:hypothetical protein
VNFYVEVLKIGTDEIVRRLGPHDERTAERVERGVSINLDHEKFYTRIVEDEQP